MLWLGSSRKCFTTLSLSLSQTPLIVKVPMKLHGKGNEYQQSPLFIDAGMVESFWSLRGRGGFVREAFANGS